MNYQFHKKLITTQLIITLCAFAPSWFTMCINPKNSKTRRLIMYKILSLASSSLSGKKKIINEFFVPLCLSGKNKTINLRALAP